MSIEASPQPPEKITSVLVLFAKLTWFLFGPASPLSRMLQIQRVSQSLHHILVTESLPYIYFVQHCARL